MKIIIYIIFLITLFDCNAQNKMNPNRQLTLEELKGQGYQVRELDTFMMKDNKLDITTLEKVGIEGQVSSVPTNDGWKSTKYYYYYELTLDDGTYVYVSGDELSGYTKQITKKDAYLQASYVYYYFGALKVTGMLYDKQLNIGTWYWYNENVEITRIEEYDKPYKFTWEDILIFMKEQEIKKDDIERIHREVKKENNVEVPYWYVSKIIERDSLGSATTVIEYTLDGNTGKVLKEEELDVTRHLD